MRVHEPHHEDLPDHRATEEVESAASQLFDLRTIIAILFGFYGIVLTIMGFVSAGGDVLAKAGGININLWSGIVMILVAVAFIVWARTRPLHVGHVEPDASDRPPMH